MNPVLWASKADREEDPSHVGLIQLAYPILLESVLRSTVGLIDVAFLSRVSDSVVGAVSVAGQYIMLSMILAMSVSSGTLVCINQALGMHNRAKVNRYASLAVITNVLLGVLFGLVFLFFPDLLLTMMTLDAEASEAAALYMQIYGGLMFFQCAEIVFSSMCRSLGRTHAPLVINLAANLVNVVGNYVAVFHPEILGISQVAGVAAASVLSRVVSLGIAFGIAFRSGIRISIRHFFPFPKEDFRLMLSIGIPGGMSNIAYSLSQLVTTSIISQTGTVMVATKVYVSNLVNYIALVGMSFSQASTLMVGYRVGAGNYKEANYIRKLVTRVAVLSNAFFSIAMIVFRVPLMQIFTSDPVIIRTASIVFLIDFVVEIGRALNNSIAGALQAAGDVMYQVIVNQASAWIVSVGGAYLFGIVFGWGLYGVWAGFALDEMTRGLILLHRWNSQKWIEVAEKRREVIAK